MLNDQLAAGGFSDFSADLESDILFKKVGLILTVLGADQSVIGIYTVRLALVEITQLNGDYELEVLGVGSSQIQNCVSSWFSGDDSRVYEL